MLNVISNKFSIAISTKHDGNMSYAFGTKNQVKYNRKNFFKQNNILSERVHIIHLTQSANIGVRPTLKTKQIKRFARTPRIDCDFNEYYSGYDGYITFDSTTVGLLTGDCIPLLLWDETTNMHGVVHVGLLGVLNGIIYNLKNIFHDYNINPTYVHCLLGPSINPKHYDLNTSGLWSVIKKQALTKVPDIEQYISNKEEKLVINIPGMAQDQLESLGILQKHILLHTEDTSSAHSNYFSHYQAKNHGGTNGRFLSLVIPKCKT